MVACACTAVILIHGLKRNPRDFKPIEKKLKQLNCKVYTVSFPSFGCQLSIRELAENYLYPLFERMRRDKEVTRVHLIGHSMGGLMIRYLLDEEYKDNGLSKVGKVIMLGTPNHGSRIIDWVQEYPFINSILKLFYGVASQGMYTKCSFPSIPEEMKKHVVTITGITHEWFDTFFANCIFKGGNDGRVSYTSVGLDGVKNFSFSVSHWSMLTNKTVLSKLVSLLLESELKHQN